ncbi:MAG: hypothetical protein H0V88_08850 [Pyrinomonadaceae bacterium]|nr:hypothetical protein [Pyrinomonadaceae bacterium]
MLSILPDNKTSQVQQYNIQFQRQLTNDTALSVGYVGTRGSNLSFYYNANAQPFGQAAGTRRFTNLGDVTVRDDIGRSTYNSLQIQLERRFARGLQYLVSYALSKTKDNSSGAFEGSRPQDINNFGAEYSNSGLDFPHVFTFSSVYDIPFGRGRRFGSEIPRALDFFIGGLQVNTILRLQSGQTFDFSVDGARVDLTGDPYDGAPAGFFLNRSAFQPAPRVNGVNQRVGTLERNGLRGPAQKQLNLGLAKNFGITERARLQFRTEFFNLTNTPQYTTPNTDFTNVNDFGRLRSTQLFTNRQIQFGLRLEF